MGNDEPPDSDDAASIDETVLRDFDLLREEGPDLLRAYRAIKCPEVRLAILNVAKAAATDQL